MIPERPGKRAQPIIGSILQVLSPALDPSFLRPVPAFSFSASDICTSVRPGPEVGHLKQVNFEILPKTQGYTQRLLHHDILILLAKTLQTPEILDSLENDIGRKIR